MKIITADSIAKLEFKKLFEDALIFLEEDFKRWRMFQKVPRLVSYWDHGVCEVMPCADDEYYTCKYVNAHPENPSKGKQSIIAFGFLADVETGYPQLIADMTLLTAVRTAATCALAAKHFAPKDSKVLGLIGTGAQSEFQVYGMRRFFNIERVYYYDRDPGAMRKFQKNMKNENVELVECDNGDEVARNADIITTCICEIKHVELFPFECVKGRNVFINSIGGDRPGKTELDVEVVKNSRIIVEFFDQTKKEGEIQNLTGGIVYDELWEVLSDRKQGRDENDTIILYDSVGFGLEDFSMLRMLYEREIGTPVDILPKPADPKDLFSIFTTGRSEFDKVQYGKLSSNSEEKVGI